MRESAMNCLRQSFRIVLVGSLSIIIASTSLRADIGGFGDFSGFSINTGDHSAAPTWVPGSLHITNQTAWESRSIFSNTPEEFATFLLSFTFQATGTPTGEFGVCAVLQNSAQHERSVAAPISSGVIARFGYQDEFGAFNRSVGFCLQR